MKYQYFICQIGLSVLNYTGCCNLWHAFEKVNCPINIEIKIRNTSLLDNMEMCLATAQEGVFIFRKEEDILLVNLDWTKAEILPRISEENFNIYSKMLFYTHAIQRRIIQFHSSLIDMQGRGLMFLGPSGIGKTTQAELWNRYRDALIINGDIVFVQETEGGFLGWGTPWHGSSPYCENASVPVEALIVLKQAPENSIRELTGFEKVTAVSNNVFYPRWLENGMELCLDVLDHLLCALPVYELSCRPDEEAVALTEKTIFGENRKW